MTLPETIYSDLKAQIPALTEALKEGASWGTDLAHRFIVYDIWVNAVSGALALLAILGLICLSVWLFKKHKGWEEEWGDGNGDLIVVLSMIAIVIVTAALCFEEIPTRASNIIKDLYIPEVRIIEVLQDNFTSSTVEK